jgi:hypothetical protein
MYMEQLYLNIPIDPPAKYLLLLALKKYDNWPIIVEGKSFELRRRRCYFICSGCDQEHWRPGVYKGEGMAQIFLHYVDQNGPNKDHAYDQKKNKNI